MLTTLAMTVLSLGDYNPLLMLAQAAGGEGDQVASVLSLTGTVVGNGIFYMLWKKTDAERIENGAKVVTLLENMTPVLVKATSVLESVEAALGHTADKVVQQPRSEVEQIKAAIEDLRSEIRRPR